MRLQKTFLTAFLGVLFCTAFSVNSAFAALPGARSGTVSGDVFLGGDYIELGISQYGSFGTDQNRPGGFFGTAARNNIGMSSDLDGFDTGTDWRMDFFMPGTQEERWGVGYTIGGSPTTAANAKRNGNLTGISNNVVTDVSSGDQLKAISIGTLSANLETRQIVSFNSGDKFFKNEVTLKNVSDDTTLSAVRYMRSFDPDNTVDKSGSYNTRNSIVYTHAAGDGKAVVQADTSGNANDPVYLGTGGADGGTRSPIFFYSSDSRARVNHHSGLVPGTVYTAAVYDSVGTKGNTVDRDAAISIAFDVGELAPGESETVIYYTSLDERDFSEVEEEIQEDEAESAPVVSEPTSETTSTTATIDWTTDILASSLIEYGLVPSYGFTTPEANTSPRVTDHTVTITGLKACARYFYRTKSTNTDLLATYSEPSTFTTSGCSLSVITAGEETNIATTGGTLALSNSSASAELRVPENFSDRAASFQINQLSTESILAPSGKQLIAGNIFDLIAVDDEDEQITTFDVPVTFEVSYADVDLSSVVESTLDVFKYIDGSWVAQNCEQDTVAKTLTCTLPSFSVYGVFGTLVGAESDDPSTTPVSSSASRSSSSSCSDSIVMSSPDLFQINMGERSATIYFTPLSQTSQYYISYSTGSNAEEHGVLVDLSSDGVQSYALKELKADSTYYFKVRGNKACSAGPWSNIRSGRTIRAMSTAVVGETRLASIVPSPSPVPAPQASAESETPVTVAEPPRHNVYVVVENEGQAVAGATIEIPTLNATAITNEKGEAFFKDIVAGAHVFTLVSDAYAADHTVEVAGDEREFSVLITVEVNDGPFEILANNWMWLLIVLLLILVIILLLKSRRKGSAVQ